MSTPQSMIYICSGVRLNPRYEHSIYFASKEAQELYFAGKVVHTFSAYSYLRKTWALQVQATMEQAKTWSYLYFYNGSGKRYYYFITNVEYKNDNTVELSLEIDVIQTYLEEIKNGLLPCFVERQHTESDSYGEHTLDEGLETGELTNNQETHTIPLNQYAIMVLASINPNYAETTTPVQALSGKYNNVFSGLKVWAVDGDAELAWANWGSQLESLSSAGFIDGIVNMWMYPKMLVELGGENTWADDDLCKTVDGSTSFDWTAPAPNLADIDGYVPKNKKLFSYPYNFAYVSNNSGGSAVLRYERAQTFGLPDFKVTGCLSPEGAVYLHPMHYNGVEHNYDEGISVGGFPTCAWDSDTYKLWLAQNQNQHAHVNNSAIIASGAGAVTAVASAASGNLLGAVGGLAGAYSGLNQIMALNAQKADMAIQPPQARGQFSANINMGMNRQSFTIYYKCVKAEHARIIDNFFTMYGYKLNRVQTPNINARKSFTYVKTVGCHIESDMCTDDVLKIESIFDKGITFWAKGDCIADYSQDNTV